MPSLVYESNLLRLLFGQAVARTLCPQGEALVYVELHYVCSPVRK